MSLNMDVKHDRIPKFNGDADQFVKFVALFEARIMQMGSNVNKAFNNKPPYRDMTYDPDANDSDSEDNEDYRFSDYHPEMMGLMERAKRLKLVR